MRRKHLAKLRIILDCAKEKLIKNCACVKTYKKGHRGIGFYPKAHPASSARSRRVVRTERAGEEVPSGDPGSAFGWGGMCLRVERVIAINKQTCTSNVQNAFVYRCLTDGICCFNLYLTCTYHVPCLVFAQMYDQVYVEVYDRYMLGTCLKTYTFARSLCSKAFPVM